MLEASLSRPPPYSKSPATSSLTARATSTSWITGTWLSQSHPGELYLYHPRQWLFGSLVRSTRQGRLRTRTQRRHLRALGHGYRRIEKHLYCGLRQASLRNAGTGVHSLPAQPRHHCTRLKQPVLIQRLGHFRKRAQPVPNGATVYARLYSKINGVWLYNDTFISNSNKPTTSRCAQSARREADYFASRI